MTDRLAALKARRQKDADPAQSAPESHQMTVMQSPQSMDAFQSEIASIQSGITQYNDNVSRISDLRARSLSAAQSPDPQDVSQLETLIADTRSLSTSLKQRIAALNTPSASAQDAQIRKNQAHLVSSKFVEAIQNYQGAEQKYRRNYKERIERQFKIVNPKATPEEVAAVVEEQNGGNQIFAQALSSSTRYGDSRAVYHEVQERHQDIRKIEQTLAELTQLFADMGAIIEQQEESINNIWENAGRVEEHTRAGLKHTEDAVEHARSWRKKKWICFIIIIVILAAVGIGLAIHFTRHT